MISNVGEGMLNISGHKNNQSYNSWEISKGKIKTQPAFDK